jgi:hypothetical protein
MEPIKEAKSHVRTLWVIRVPGNQDAGYQTSGYQERSKNEG